MFLATRIKKTSLYTALITVFLVHGCNKTSRDIIKIPNKTNTFKLNIDPDSAISGRFISTFLDSITFLPLETTKESMFSQINQLEVTSRFYIVWDKGSNSILFFKKNGQFENKISQNDSALKIPFKKINGFTVNEEKNELSFEDIHSKYIYVYSLEGRFIRFFEKPKSLGNAFMSIGNFNVYFQGYHCDEDELDSIHGDLNIVKDRENFDSYLPFDPRVVDNTDIFSVDKYFYNSQNGITNFVRPYDYNVYSITKDAILSSSYEFILPESKVIPIDFMTNSSYKGERMKYTNSNPSVIYAITDFYQDANNLTFKFGGHSYSEVFIYNLKTNHLLSLSDYISDMTSYMLPIHGGRILGVDKDAHLISSVDAVELFRNKLVHGGNKAWDLKLPISLKRFFESDNLQNPVLTFLSLKQEI